MTAKATTLGEMMRNDGHYAVQGHSRSSLLLPVESLYSCYCIILTYVISRTAPKILRFIGQIFAVDRGCLSNASQNLASRKQGHRYMVRCKVYFYEINVRDDDKK